MVIDYLLVSVGVLGLIIGSITDFKKREVADWLNYFMIISGLGLRLIHSIYTLDWSFFIYGLLGFGSFLALAYVMLLTGQWGGGDSKMLMAIGALFATMPGFVEEMFNPQLFGFPFLLSFWINLLLVGAIYGIIWTLGIGLFHLKDLRKSWRSWMSDYSVSQMRTISHLAALVLLVGGFLSYHFTGVHMLLIGGASFTVMLLTFFYLYIFVKSVEESCMYRLVTPEDLVEGDWPFDDIKVDGKIIYSKDKKVGMETKDIEMLKRFYKQSKIKRIKVKHGVPFVPSFLLSLIVTSLYGNLIIFLIL